MDSPSSAFKVDCFPEYGVSGEKQQCVVQLYPLQDCQWMTCTVTDGSLDDALVISLVEDSPWKTPGGIGYEENQTKAHNLLHKVEEQFLFKDYKALHTC